MAGANGTDGQDAVSTASSSLSRVELASSTAILSERSLSRDKRVRQPTETIDRKRPTLLWVSSAGPSGEILPNTSRQSSRSTNRRRSGVYDRAMYTRQE